MAKPEWGTKRICQSCGARFYDLRRDPPLCPGCGTVVAVKSAAKLRRAPAVAAVQEKAPPVPVEPVVAAEAVEETVPEAAEEKLGDEAEALDKENGDTDDLNSDEEDDSLIEDTSELGEDDDDMSEVMDHIVDDDLSDRS